MSLPLFQVEFKTSLTFKGVRPRLVEVQGSCRVSGGEEPQLRLLSCADVEFSPLNSVITVFLLLDDSLKGSPAAPLPLSGSYLYCLVPSDSNQTE